MSPAPTTPIAADIAPPTAPSLPHEPLLRRAVIRFSSMILMLSAGLLIIVAIAALIGVRFRVERTGSMAPAIKSGDLLAMKSVSVQTVHRGQVIGVRDPQGAVIVHRVLDIGQGKHHSYEVVTRGDANPTSEHWSISAGKPVALVVGRLPYAGEVVNHLRGVIVALIVLLAGCALALLQLRSVWSRR
jgi:signal peptidase I